MAAEKQKFEQDDGEIFEHTVEPEDDSTLDRIAEYQIRRQKDIRQIAECEKEGRQNVQQTTEY